MVGVSVFDPKLRYVICLKVYILAPRISNVLALCLEKRNIRKNYCLSWSINNLVGLFSFSLYCWLDLNP